MTRGVVDIKRSLGIVLLLVCMLAGCGLKTQTLADFYNGDLGNVTKVVIVDGSTGNQKAMEEQRVIGEFLKKIRQVKFIPEKNQDKRKGWRYGIQFYEGDKETFQFFLN